MTVLKRLAERHPVLSFLALAYGISWAVWFSVPLAAGDEWALVKVFVGVGGGPGLAAALLDRARGTAGPAFTNAWWARFAAVGAPVAAVCAWGLLVGDAPDADALAGAVPAGLTAAGVLGSLLAGIICGSVFASAAGSRSAALHSIVRLRAPLRWWLVALLLPAALMLVSNAITAATGGTVYAPAGAGLSGAAWAAYLVRAALFTFLVVAVVEETGWRGWMLPALQDRFSPLASSVFLGVAWGLWHFPLFVVGLYDAPPDTIVQYLFVGPVMAVLFTWVYNRTGGNLLLALVLHTSINNTPRVVPDSDLFPVLLVGLTVALVATERMWRRPGRTEIAAEPACLGRLGEVRTRPLA